MDQSRSTPSSCEDEVRRRVGQYGQTGLRSTSGGIGNNSKLVTETAPVAVRSTDAVRAGIAAAMTTTCLSFAQSSATPLSPATRLFCRGRKSIA